MRPWSVAERGIAAALVAAGVILPLAALARRRPEPPTVLLFVSRRCPACRSAAIRLDSLVLRRAQRAIILSDSGNWSQVAPHVGVVFDSDHALAQALGIAAVPALVTITAVVRYDFAR